MNDQSKKISANKAKKATIVAEIEQKVEKAKGMVFTNYTGLTHKQLETFKREIKKADADFVVSKNTLLKRALEKSPSSDLKSKEKMDGQTGTMFLYGDIVAPLKTLAKLIKELQKPEIKYGYLDGKVVTSAEVIKISSLPSREQLIAQLVGAMKSPIYGLHRSLQWNIQKFVLILKAIEAKKV